MARRISAFFSSKDIKDEDLPRVSSGSHLDEAVTSPRTPPRGKLTKPMTKSPSDLHLNTRLDTDLEPPPVFTNSGISSRPLSRDGRSPVRKDTAGSRQSSSSRPQTPTLLSVPGTASPVNEQSPRSARTSKRKSWLPGKSDKQVAGGGEQPLCQAWIAGLREQIPYDITKLLNGERVDDLWDESGDVLVHIFPSASEKGPSFRVSSQLFADSRLYPQLVDQRQSNGHQQGPHINLTPSSPLAAMSIQDRFGRGYPQQYEEPSYAPPEEPEFKSIHLPLELDTELAVPGAVPRGDDMELVVLYRNFFAFLCGGALVATQRQNSLYAIFMGISSILRRLQYGNEKDSSWGAIPWASFSRYTEELRLADVRSSREKNIEAIVLGEAMKSWPLYAEGFSHAVGRLEDIKSIRSPKYAKMSNVTIQRLERASHDLQRDRLLPLHSKLDNFYFPSMFSGIANSQTATESKLVRFKAWKTSFMDFRTFVLAQYKKRYGSWPPKASSKKNNFEESGLNRLLLREVYQDFINLYELLVDQTSLTPRTRDMPTIADDAEIGSSETIQHALRSVESEYDRSTPPVAPPIPFDVPLIPAFGKQMLAREAQNAKKIKDNELHDLLLASYNRDSFKQTPWVQEYLEYERKMCHGKTVQDIADVRCGHWLFIYAILQALPMTVVDARDLQFTEGVEYFLCEAPRGGRPWMVEDSSTSRSWYNVASGGGLVSMPADIIDHSVEGIYRRSYCWTIATKWAEEYGSLSPAQPVQRSVHFPPRVAAPSPYLVPSPAPGSAAPSPLHSPIHSPSLQPAMLMPDDVPAGLPRISSRTSMNMGLEEVAAPAKTSRPASQYNPNLTFDTILSTQKIEQKKGKKVKN